MSEQEMADAFAGVRGMLDYLEAALLSGQADPEKVRVALAKMVGAVMDFQWPRTSKKPKRPIGYSKDDALIVASIPDYDNSLTKAIRAHHPKANPDEVKVHAKRISKHKAEIEAAGVPDRIAPDPRRD
jgi:hypothetical protein